MLYDEEGVVVVAFIAVDVAYVVSSVHFKVMGVYARHVYYDINDDKRWGCMPDMSYYDIIDGGLCLDGTTCMCIC